MTRFSTNAAFRRNVLALALVGLAAWTATPSSLLAGDNYNLNITGATS